MVTPICLDSSEIKPLSTKYRILIDITEREIEFFDPVTNEVINTIAVQQGYKRFRLKRSLSAVDVYAADRDVLGVRDC